MLRPKHLKILQNRVSHRVLSALAATMLPILVLSPPWPQETTVDAYVMPTHVGESQARAWSTDLLGHRTEMTYEHVGSYAGSLYLFRPEHVTTEPNPLVVYFHGGGLDSGSAVIGPSAASPHNWILSHLEASLIRHGIAFASVNYRLAPEYMWPAQIDDAKASIRYIRANASALHIDSHRIVVIGDSAGGALASLVGLTAGSDPIGVGPLADQWDGVSGVIDMFGPADRQYLADAWRVKYRGRPNPVFGWLTPTVVRDASAVTYVHPGSPPFLIVQGVDDTVVPPWVSQELYDRLRQAGNAVQMISVEHSEHEFRPYGGPISPSENSLVQSMESFLIRCVQWPDSRLRDAALSVSSAQPAHS